MLHVKFYKIPCNKIRDTTITRTLEKKEKQCPLLCYRHVNVSLLFLIICISYINFSAISFNKSQSTTTLRILGKTNCSGLPEIPCIYLQKLDQCH